MSVREKINQHQTLAIIVAAVLLVFSLGFAIQTYRGTGAGSSFAKKAYFTIDDGATYFVDSAQQPYPFDHDGKPAYRACVYKFGNSAPYVAYLERYTEAGKQAVAPFLGSTDIHSQDEYRTIRETELEAKKPGRTKWYRAGTPGFISVTQSVLPPGAKGDATMVLP